MPGPQVVMELAMVGPRLRVVMKFLVPLSQVMLESLMRRAPTQRHTHHRKRQ